jgi:hypothetical protein
MADRHLPHASSALAAAALGLLVFACSPAPQPVERACTRMGCEDGLAVELAGAPPPPFRVEVRAGGAPQVRECPTREECAQLFFPGVAAEEVTVEVIAAGARTTRTLRPEISSVQPNGAGCPPTCRQGRVRVAWQPAAGPPPAAGTTPSPTRGGGADPDAGWTHGVLENHEAAVGVATLQAIRAASHDDYDRVVFEFAGVLPGYHLEYVDKPVRSCGSGEVVPLPGDGWLEVRLEPAAAHTEAGQPTVGREVVGPGGNLRSLKLTCDFEAVVTWVLAVESPNDFRVTRLDGPPRLVVDVRRR